MLAAAFSHVTEGVANHARPVSTLANAPDQVVSGLAKTNVVSKIAAVPGHVTGEAATR